MTRWTMHVTEPTLDELLEDEMMKAVVRSAGTNVAELKARLAETARRLAARRAQRRERCPAYC